MTNFLLYIAVVILGFVAIGVKRIGDYLKDAVRFRSFLLFRHELERVHFMEHVGQLHVPGDSLWESGSDFRHAGDKDDLATQLRRYQEFRTLPDDQQERLRFLVDFVERLASDHRSDFGPIPFGKASAHRSHEMERRLLQMCEPWLDRCGWYLTGATKEFHREYNHTRALRRHLLKFRKAFSGLPAEAFESRVDWSFFGPSREAIYSVPWPPEEPVGAKSRAAS